MSLHTLLAFWTISILLAATPGADWAYVISAGIRDHAAVVPAVLGLFLGYLAITVTVAGGSGALVASMPLAVTILTFAGAAYLVKLGMSLLRHPPLPKEGHERETSVRRWITRGFAISGLNPKALLFFLALLLQFTNPGSSWPIFLQIGILGIIHTINCVSIYTDGRIWRADNINRLHIRSDHDYAWSGFGIRRHNEITPLMTIEYGD